MPECTYVGCDNDGTRVRQSERDGSVFQYCEDHDPLGDGNQSFAFTEVEGDQ